MSAKMKFVNVIAAAAAVAFVTAPMTANVAQAAQKKPCYGINSCKGRSQCKTAKNDCKGKNSCKGQGYVMTTPKQCAKKGGTLKEPA